MDMEPSEATPDLVGRTSARLLAAGVDRRARLDALRLLAILDASSDGEGRVRRPLDDLAAEFELEPLLVIEGLDHLELAEAIHREGATVVVGGDGSGLGGMQLADFLEDVQASFAGSTPTKVQRRARATRIGAAVLATAAAVAILTLAPSTQPTVVQPLAASSTTAAPAPADPTTTAVDIDVPVPTTAATAATAGETPAAGTEPTTTAAPTVDTSVVAATVCPTASPLVQVLDDVVRVTNPTDEDLDVTALSVGGITFTVPFTVPAGGFIDRPLLATLTDAPPTVPSWHWTDPSVARTCPS
jgi:hypothetical protein